MSAVIQLAQTFSANRLYSLDADDPIAALQVERWTGEEHLSALYRWDIHALSTDPGLDLDAMLGQRVVLRVSLTDGSTAARSGLVEQAECIGFDAGLARYRLQLVPWLAALAHGRDQRTFENQGIADILGRVFNEYRSIASWRFTADANQRLQAIEPSDYVVQYRTHSHLEFIDHVLATAGFGYTFVEDEQAPSHHTMLIFDDSTQLGEDVTSSRLDGVQQRISGMTTEPADTIIGIGQSFSLMADRITVLSGDYRGNQSVTASASLGNPTGACELYDDVGPEAFDSLRHAQDAAHRQADAFVSAARVWMGFSTIRTANAGRFLRVANAAWQQVKASSSGTASNELLVTGVRHLGINNLPAALVEEVESRLGALPAGGIDPRVLVEAKAGGYANQFDAVTRSQPWRPTLEDGTGQRLNPVATAPGSQTAIVAGPAGSTTAGASGPVHTDAQGRLWLRFHWQAAGDDGGYPTRAMQRLASDGHGMQITQRIGQEALVQFQNGLIHRPIVLGGLYNGRGEGGNAPTPGGSATQQSDTTVFAQSTDLVASAQSNLAGGNSPAWHGAASATAQHGHAGALSGFKSQGFDGNGANQMVSDDSDGMGRLQMGTTQAATQLNLGHLRHQSDNFTGSFRGQGFELRTDGSGALRAERGALITSYAASPSQPAGEVSALQSLLAQQRVLAQLLDASASQHLTVPFSVQRGVQSASQSQLDASAAPLDAFDRSIHTTVGSAGYQQALADAQQRQKDKALPHSGDALLAVAAQGGQGILAGQGLQWSAGETMATGSGGDTNLVTNARLNVHTGQAIGWLAASRGTDATGLALIAGADDLRLAARGDALALRAKDDLTVSAVHANVDLLGKQVVNLAVSGGAHLTIEGGKVTFGCPGTLTVHAAQHQFLGADGASGIVGEQSV
ncbi:type VI secretion system Vgr family protein [Paraburkholderia sp. J67]|uniref:type VI secretion system Vgr family protein n=1 Tax=Paraburkholderia sp. J67 TaxID=2805435 RepID=UPI002ABD2A0C|nr:type VI secretion system Vgr family protein [Paraburkholderia sp. J67]